MTTEPVETTPRRAARVLLIDAEGRVLLLRGCDPARPEHRYWFTVGGGLDQGESSTAGAVRELYEETGLRLTEDDLVGPVFAEVTTFPFDGVWYEQTQDFYTAHVDSWEVDLSGLDGVEKATVDAHRWWGADELDATGERFYPTGLAALVRATRAA